MTERQSSPGWRLRSAGRALLQGGVELLLFFLAVLWFYIYFSPVSLTPWLIMLAACYPIGNLLAGLVRVRKAAVFYLVIAAVAAVPAFAMFGGVFSIRLFVVWLLLAVLSYRGALMSVKRWNELFPDYAYVIGLIGYFIASIVTSAAESWQPYAPEVLWLGLISLALTLFTTNRFHLNRSAPAGFSVSASIASRNWIWLSILFAVILFLSFFSVIGRFIKMALAFIAYIFASILAWLMPDVPRSDIQLNLSPPARLPEQTKKDPTIWDLIALYAAKALLYLFIALAVAIIGYYTYKGLVWLIRKIMRASNELAAGPGFVDEKKRLMGAPERSKWGSRLRLRLGSMLKRELRWEQMADWRERVRWLYRRRLTDAIRRGYELKKQLTPQETLQNLREWEKQTNHPRDAKLAKLYEQARYSTGERQVNEAEIAELHDLIS